MLELNKKSILVVLQPHRKYEGSLLEMLVDGIKTTGISVDFLDITNLPKYEYNKRPFDRIQNIFHRIVDHDQQYFLILESNSNSKYYRKVLKNFKNKNQQVYDYVLIIKPEEFSPKFVKELRQLGNKTVGYIWDGLRMFFKPNLERNRKYLDDLYSFDTNNIKEHPDLEMHFCTNFGVKFDDIIPYKQREIDLFYVGDLAGKTEHQRRDKKLSNLLRNVSGNFDVNIYLNEAFKNIDKLKDSKITYIEEIISMKEGLERTRKSKVVIDVCKAHHIGLSFRFFECMMSETKVITNNIDVKKYDFYNPKNIMIVDFDTTQLSQNEFEEFLKTPYQSLQESILEKYEINNWLKYLFKIGDYIPITKK